MRIALTVPLLMTLALQQIPAPPGFKSGINLVEVDVVVLDKRGMPVRGLGQTDFQLFEDDKPVPIVTFDAVDLPRALPDAPIPIPDRSGSSFASNEQPEDGRVLLIVMDDHHVRIGGSEMVMSRRIARALVERLGPSDQAAVMATSGRSVMQAEFTADKARLVEAIDRFFPQAEAEPGIAETRGSQRGTNRAARSFGAEQELRARWAMDALSNAAKALALIPHRRKAILLVSEGLPVSVEEVVSNPNASGAWQSFRDFILTAQRSNIAVYPVDPCGLGLECSFPAQENLRTLAENTGGFAVVNTNAPEEQVGRIVAENGLYYLVGYASPAPPYDGRRHRIKVRTRMSDVEVRARESYVSPRRPPVASIEAPGDALIAAPIQSRGLAMRVAAVPTPMASSPGAAIVIAIEVPARIAIEAARIEFTVAAIDPSSAKVRARQRFTNTFEARGANTPAWARLRSHLALPPGRYLLRVAAVGANNTRGSVFTEVDVPKFDGELALGGLSIAVPGTRSTAVDEAGGLKGPALTPVAAREVPSDVPLVAEVPIRLDSRATSTPVRVTATLRKPDGSTMALDGDKTEASAFATREGAIYRVALPRGLASGAYRLAVEAIYGRARVTREIAFRVTDAQPTSHPLR